MPTPAAGRSSPVSRFLIDFNFADGLDSLFRLVARSGQVLSFARGGTMGAATAIDRNGLLYVPGVQFPRFTHQLNATTGLWDPAGILLEGAATNVVLWPRDLTNAAWTKTSCTAAHTQVGVDGAANSASLLTATGANATCLQAITLSSSARAQSARVRRVTGTGTVQMTTDGGGTWTPIVLTAAWTRFYIPVQTLANPSVGFRIVTNGDAIAVDLVQNETGVWTSEIPTTTAAVTRSADVLSVPLNALPRDGTLYLKAVDMGATAIGGGNARAAAIGAAAAAAPTLYLASSGGKWSANYNSNNGAGLVTTGAPATSVSRGDTMELLASLSTAGAAAFAQSINAATDDPGSATAAEGIPGAWSGATLYLGRGDASASFVAPIALQIVRYAAAVQTLSQLRAA